MDQVKKSAKEKSHPFWQWFWLTFLAVSLFYAWYSFYAPSNDVKWVNNITSVKELTKNSSKNTLLFFTGKWCSPCRIMKREVFSDNEVERFINLQFTPVMVDIDNPDTKELVEHFKVGITPTTIILDAQGKVLDYAVGKIGKEEFLEMLSK
ncbi:thioredoxin family protein [Namhaeicola litoreus]|uniref:Thioredoxin family protein n=1 Tax=Namhaeicola litoreus TaxID=1052145 RepID=A0ABW3Y159_9FLAO